MLFANIEFWFAYLCSTFMDHSLDGSQNILKIERIDRSYKPVKFHWTMKYFLKAIALLFNFAVVMKFYSS